MSDGEGCTCAARSAGECCCDDVDWTPQEVLDLRAEVSRLREIGKATELRLSQEQAEVSRLTAELAELRAQKPVAWRLRKPGNELGLTSYSKEQAEQYVTDWWEIGQTLYASPIPAAQIDPRFATVMYQHDLK